MDKEKNEDKIFQLPSGFSRIGYSTILGMAPANTVEAFRTNGFLGYEICKGDAHNKR